MKAATPSAQAQPGTTQQPTRVVLAATSGEQPSPHPSNAVYASSRAAGGSLSADALHHHSDHNTSGSPSVAAALNSQQHSMQSYQAQTQSDTSLLLPHTQEDQTRTADGMHVCTEAVGMMYGVGGLLHGAGGGMRGAGGAMQGARGPMHDAGGPMHDDLWTQEGSVVEYPAAYRQQVRFRCDSTLCQADTSGLLVRRPADIFVTCYLKPTVTVLLCSSWRTPLQRHLPALVEP